MSETDVTRPRWRKSTYSGEQNCVEVADLPHGVAVRDSKNIGGPALTFLPAGWGSFLAAAKAGDFDRP